MKAVKSIVFLLILLAVLLTADRILRIKGFDGPLVWDVFYEQPKDSIDVLILGSSHAYTGLNPAVFWEEQGFSSYVLGSAQQTIYGSYYSLVEALKYQSPQLILLDIYRVTGTSEYLEKEKAALGFMNMRLSRNKIERIQAEIAPEDRADYYLQFPVYHQRYAELEKRDFAPYYGEKTLPYFKGFEAYQTVLENGQPKDFSDNEKETKLYEKSEEYFVKILELAKEKKIPVLLTATPFVSIDVTDHEMFNEAEEIAAGYGVTLIDFNSQEMYDKIGFNPSSDFADETHVTLEGGRKVSKYLADYIAGNYKIPDHRGEKGYESWEENWKIHDHQYKNERLESTVDVEQYVKILAELAKEDYMVVITTSQVLTDQQLMQRLGNLIGIQNFHADGMWILQNGAYLYHNEEGEEPDFYHKTDQMEVTVHNGTIQMENTVFPIQEAGIHFRVYDEILGECVDNITFEYENAWEIVR